MPILRILLLAGLALPLGASAAQTVFDEVLSHLQIDILPVQTNRDVSADYLLYSVPSNIRFRPMSTLSPAEARRLLPTLIIDDPDTGLNTGSDSKKDAVAKDEDSPALKADEEARQAGNQPPEPATQVLRAVQKPNLIAPLAPVVEPSKPKVTVVESPPPLAQMYEESRRRKNRQLRNLVPYFLGQGTNTSTNRGPVGLTNSLVPFAPPVFNQ